MTESVDSLELEDIKIDPSLLTIEESLDIMSTSATGISAAEAQSRLGRYGENKIPEKKGKSKFRIFIGNFKNPLVYALLAAAVFAFILHEYVDVAVILVVVCINAVIGYVQEIKAKKDIDALKRMTAFHVKAIREGKTIEIDAALLVPGDIVILEEGARIPSDGRIIKAKNLLVNESSLTGESVLIFKTDEKINQKNQITPKNMVFQGTTVAEGYGEFVVFTTGANTRFGKIALFAQDTESTTPIQKKIERLSGQIGFFVLIACILVILAGMSNGQSLLKMIQLSVSLAVSAIPEGLPIAVTVVLVLGAKRMAKRKAIVRNMMAVETLGTTTVIATDKTGTLTHNKLKVTAAYTTRTYSFEMSETGHKGSYFYNDKEYFGDDIKKILTVGAVCNNAELDKDRSEVIGEATDAAILENALMCGVRENHYAKLDEVPFTSQKRFMAVLSQDENKKVIYIKGAPEQILEKCHYYFKEKNLVMTDDIRAKIKAKIDEMSKKGLRVVALAEKSKFDSFKDSLDSEFVFLGLLGMKDTYRVGVKEAIQKCKEAGIKVIMLTGDHLETAKTIATKLGILNKPSEAILAEDIFLEGGAQKRNISEIAVFARILPENKYKIIDYFKSKGEIVAMTGDGVNDVPALRKADIGIAMGLSGTDAAKEAADIVLADDNFATIVAAVEEGRTIFANLRKTLLYIISTSIGEVLAVLGSLVFALPVPVSPLQILWINLITDTSATIPLGVEPKEDDHLKIPPRKPKEGLISTLMVRRSLLVGFYMAIVAILIFKSSLAMGIDYARTITFLFLSISQWFNAFNCRSEKKSISQMKLFSNPSLVFGIALGLIAQLIVMYVVFFQNLFSFVPVGLREWMIAILASFGLIILIEADKLVGRFFVNRKKA